MSDRTELRINRTLLRWVLLGLGLIALIVALIAWFAVGETGDKTVTWIALAVGVVGIAGFVMLDPEAIVQAITGRTAQQGAISLLMTIFFLAAVIGGYYILYRATTDGVVDDLVKPDEYKLHEVTIEMLENLEEPVHVTAFVSLQEEEPIRKWLQEYKRYGGENFTYEFVDPDLEPLQAQALDAQSGSIIFQMGDDRTATADFADESNLTGALARVQMGEPRTAYMLTGHGERSLDDPAQTGFSNLRQLMTRANFTVNPLNLATEGAVPEDADVLIIAGPTIQFSQADVEMLQAYLDGGGSLYVMVDPGQGIGASAQGVLAVEYSADGDFVATAGADGTVKIWNEDSGEEVATLRGHTGSVVDVDFSPDGSQLVTAGFDGRVIVWSDEGEIVAELAGETGTTDAVAWSPDGSTITSVGGNVINVWDADSFEPLYAPIAVADKRLFAVAYSPDGSQIAVGGGAFTATARDGSVLVYEVESGENTVSVTPHTNVVLALAFTPDGEEIISGAVDGTVGTTDAESGDNSVETLYPQVGISGLDIQEDGTQIFGLYDGTIHVHDADASSAEDDEVLSGHTNIVIDVAASPDGREIASASLDSEARIWTIGDRDPRVTMTGHATADPLLDYLSTAWGINVGEDLVIDLPSQQYTQTVENLVVVTYDQSSEITRSLAQSGQQELTIFSLARSITAGAAAPTGVTVTPLLFSMEGTLNDGTPVSWAETTDPFATEPFYDEADIAGPVSIAVSSENTDGEGRVIVVGDADFISNSGLSATNFQNDQFFTNGLNWLTGGEVGVEIPPADPTVATWDNPFSPVMLFIVQVSMACLIPLIFIVVGAIVWFIRRRRR